MINGVIDLLNGIIEKMNNLPGVKIPLISHIGIDLPNADATEQALAEIARARTIQMFIHAVPPNNFNFPGVGQFAEGTPFVPQTQLAIVHKGEAIIPADQNRGGLGGVTLIINGDVVGLSKTELADEIGRVFTQQRRMQGLA